MNDYEIKFVRDILMVAIEHGHLGFEDAKLEFGKITIKWTTIIVNGLEMMEIEIYDPDFLYWRTIEIKDALHHFNVWVNNYAS